MSTPAEYQAMSEDELSALPVYELAEAARFSSLAGQLYYYSQPRPDRPPVDPPEGYPDPFKANGLEFTETAKPARRSTTRKKATDGRPEQRRE